MVLEAVGTEMKLPRSIAHTRLRQIGEGEPAYAWTSENILRCELFFIPKLRHVCAASNIEIFEMEWARPI